MKPQPERVALRPPGSGPMPIYDKVIVAIVGLVVIWLYYRYNNPVPDLRGDQAQDSFAYIELAKGLLRGDGYPTKHLQPGFPLVLATWITAVGLDFYWLKLFAMTCGLATAALSIRLFQRAGYPHVAPLLGCALAATPIFFDYSHRLMSEIPFLACSTIALLALLELQHASTTRQQLTAGILLSVFAPFAVLIRGNGLALVPAVGSVIILNRGRTGRGIRRWLYGALATMATVFFGWMLWGRSHDFEGIRNVTYFQEVQSTDLQALWASGGAALASSRVTAAGMVRRIYENIAWYQVYNADATVWPGANHLAEVQLSRSGSVLAFLGLIPAVIGAVHLARRVPALFVWLVCSILLVLWYPTGGAARMLLPSVPILILAFYMGFEGLVGARGAFGLLLCAAIANLFACAVQGDMQARTPYVGNPYGTNEAAREVLSLIREDLTGLTAADSLIVSDYAEVIRALTDRRAVGRPTLGRG